MEGIYFTTMCNIKDPNDNTDPGIKSKIQQQLKAFYNSDIHMYFYYAHNNSKYYRYLNRLPFFKDRYSIDYETIKKSSFIYLRKPSTINMGFIDFLRKIKGINPKIIVILEIPTFPYDNEIQGLIRLTLKLKDRVARQRLKEYVDVILTYSDDREIFGIKTINISNGVDAISIKSQVDKNPIANDGVLRFMACAKFNLWHGYDRVLEGLNNYLKSSDNSVPIEIEMVGDGTSLEAYKQLVSKYNLQKYVIFHGKLQGDDLAKVYSKCDIGFDSMGRHRSGVYYNSSLKGKEYCAYGLMIVSGVETELDHDNSFEYYYRIPADDSPVDFNAVIEFYKNKMVSVSYKEQIREKIMNYAVSKFDISVVFLPVIKFIEESTKENK